MWWWILKIIEREKNNPVNILSDVYGIGPKKAQELVDQGITTIEQLRTKQKQVLNDTQIVGLKYYEDIFLDYSGLFEPQYSLLLRD